MRTSVGLCVGGTRLSADGLDDLAWIKTGRACYACIMPGPGDRLVATIRGGKEAIIPMQAFIFNKVNVYYWTKFGSRQAMTGTMPSRSTRDCWTIDQNYITLTTMGWDIRFRDDRHISLIESFSQIGTLDEFWGFISLQKDILNQNRDIKVNTTQYKTQNTIINSLKEKYLM